MSISVQAAPLVVIIVLKFSSLAFKGIMWLHTTTGPVLFVSVVISTACGMHADLNGANLHYFNDKVWLGGSQNIANELVCCNQDKDRV